jgi:3-methyladenine DNA glycosylase AlkC
LKPILANIEALKKQTVNTINEAIGIGLFEQSLKSKDAEIVAIISTHASDSIRCWATYTIGRNQQLDIRQKLERIQPFSADTHFGVREISWLSVRPSIAKNIIESIGILSGWTIHKDEYVRRFATEATRPRGVWCEHIEQLKQNPELGLAILEPMKSDKAKYVQDSVGNWLNDASKTQPQFVVDICKKWEKESETKETAYIIKKAMRTIEK